MILYRLGLLIYSKDLSGAGAKLFGGRWNHKGSTVLYTSENSSLCALEKIAQTGIENLPPKLYLSLIEVPDDQHPEIIDGKTLPKNWNSFPSPPELRNTGALWLSGGKKLLLKVPSSVNIYEYNFLINPAHKHFGRVKLVDVLPFEVDRRLSVNLITP